MNWQLIAVAILAAALVLATLDPPAAYVACFIAFTAGRLWGE